MNFLAHIYLSGDNPLITIGNFMADGIKGRRYEKQPKDIQIGILLHREIDTFTDAHPTVRLSTKRLHKNYSHYSGVIVDILYDHFLAKNWSQYSNTPLDLYVANFYDSLKTNFELLPLRIQKMMPYMIADNWLLSYAQIEGIQKVLNGMNHRTNNISGMNSATNELQEFYDDFEDEFTIFFEELRVFSNKKLTALQHMYALQ
ncbi:acyl carrier protein phosphodiesterase [Gelidibacter algens]|uniref:Acyl carrier protein phosphodiesterase n=1 Tax=Gelidibacter algens TaxID=49280 RepID=A0A1A7R1R7_9FLAO|nr:acyl carrier protein phosphodiesterase [Gelidibacter algens]OBX25766.1 ACP phosphodiesterase [Gelidibacter algens]RAJ21114.1 acyl carrier protein phosphodiesterase [Gelidibacter algens]